MRDARLDLTHEHLHALEVFARGLQFRLRFLEALAVEADFGRLFDQRAAIFGPQAEHLLDHALPHEGVTVLANLGAHEQLDDVAQADAGAVDEVLVFAVAVGAAGDDHLVEVDGEPLLSIVERYVDFCDTHRRALLAASEDHVFGLAGAQGAAGVFAKDPT